MKEDFEKNLSESQAAEKKALEEYEMLKAAKEDEIATAQKLVVELDADIAEFTEKHAQAASELEDTEKQLADDTEFLASLTKKCADADAQFQARTKSRNEEIAAVEDTIEYLNSDEAYAVFDKAVNTAEGSNKFSSTAFVQISAKSGEQERERRNQVSALLQQKAGQLSSPQLALVAARVQLDAFTEVKKEIDKMLAELKTQQADEVEHRDWCISELNANERSTTHAYDTKAALEAKIADLEKTIEQLTTDIKTAKDTIAETMTQMKRAGETREVENAGYQQVVSDQIITQAILKKALDRMKEVYAFLQGPGAPHTQTSATRTDPGNGPAKFTKYEQNAGGKKVVAMIEEVIADSQKTEDEAHASEADAQTAYEDFVKDSNKSITQLTTSINDMTVSLAKAKEDLSMAKSDFAQTMKELEGLNAVSGDLHASCDYVLKNFEARQAARQGEMDSLNEAKQILSGA
jgi:chromosome segregation ATPase